MVHHAVRADEDLVDDVISSMRADGIDVDARIAAVIARYRRHAAARGEDPSRIDERYAMEEVVADYIGEICRNDRYLPVSYTHLDVYKRQGQGLSRWLSLLCR